VNLSAHRPNIVGKSSFGKSSCRHIVFRHIGLSAHRLATARIDVPLTCVWSGQWSFAGHFVVILAHIVLLYVHVYCVAVSVGLRRFAKQFNFVDEKEI